MKKKKTKQMEVINVDSLNDFKKEEPQYQVLTEGEFNPEELFSNDGIQGETTVIKELFNPKNPKIKTELSDDEIKIISRLYVLSHKYYEPRKTFLLKNVLDEFVILRISKDRKSRAEFVEANKDIQKNKGGGFLEKVFGGTNKNL